MSESHVESPAENPAPKARTEHVFQAEVEQVLRLVVHSLYSNKEIFLRELLSNASDALDKRRFRALTDASLAPSGEPGIRLEADASNKTLTLHDDGIGMTHDELVTHLGTIAKSGSRELLEALGRAGEKGDLSLIGQFGVGFYSAFLVADRVEVVSRAAGQSDAWCWASDAKRAFTLEPATREAVGTSVVLHLGADHLDLLRAWKLEELVRRYSDFLPWPIEVRHDGKDGEAPSWKRVNQGRPIWQRAASEVTKEQYVEFYRHVSHAYDEPLAWKHFRVEGSQEFAGLLYVPTQPPFDLFSPEPKHGIRLHVKRVFIMEDCDQLLPRWLRFVRGVVDSEDLPLNVSRELLQDSRLTRVIRKQVTRQVLDALAQLEVERPEDYATFWKTFGPVFKEGLHYEPDQVERLSKLLRYESTAGEGWVSLAAYKARMKEGQKAIFYVLGESRRQIESSPHLEGLRKRGFEVLYMTDSVDAFAVQALSEFDGVPLVSATSAELDLGEGDDAAKEAQGGLAALRERMRVRLEAHVSEVRTSARLTDSPACLVIPEGGLAPHMERLFRATQQGLPAQKRILEINPGHPLVVALETLTEKKSEFEGVDEWIDLLFEQALVAEGSPIEDPGRFTRRLTALLTDAATLAARDS